MELTTKPSAWITSQGLIESEGRALSEKNLRDVCTYFKVSATLLSIDERYGTSTFLEVVKKAVKEVKFRDSDKGLVVQDPLSRFVEDSEFDDLVALMNKNIDQTPQEQVAGLSRRVEWVIPQPADFLGDVFTKKVIVERLPQGGVNYSTGLLRQICTNGMVVADRDYTKLARKNIFPEKELNDMIARTIAMSVDEYFKSLFTVNGEYVTASVSDVRAMKNCLAKMTTPEIALSYFPMDDIKATYEEQGIEIDKTPSKQLDRMPSGLTYYEAFNILTNGSKQAEQTLENHVEIAKFARPSKMKVLRQLAAQYSAIPVFSETQKKRLMGDI